MRDPGNVNPGAGPLSVAYLSPSWPHGLVPNGVVTYVSSIVSAMRDLGHHPYVLAGLPSSRGSELEDGVLNLSRRGDPTSAIGRTFDRVRVRLSPDAAREARNIRAIRRAVGELAEGPGLHLLEMEECFGWCGGVAGYVPIPVIARLHGPWFLNGPNNGADPQSASFRRRVSVEGRALARVDAVTAPSRDVLERTVSRYGLEFYRSEVIPNPTPTVAPGSRWRPDRCDPDRVLFVGRFDRHKGGDTIIDAFARLLHDRPTARLTFIGPDRGIVRDGRSWSLEQYVERRLPGALRDGRVEWLGGRPHGELPEFRRRAAVTVVASRYETFAITVAEAMAAGCPLVSTRAGGAGELFEHGRHGLYVEPDDPDGMCAAIEGMIADPAKAAAMGRDAAEHCSRRFAPEAVADLTVSFYRRVLDDHAVRRHPSSSRPRT